MQLNAVSEDSKERKESLVKQTIQRNRAKKKIEQERLNISCKDGHNKGQKRKGPNRS